MSNKPIIYIPTDTNSTYDVDVSYKTSEPLRKHGFETGFLHLLKNGLAGLTGKQVEARISNIKNFTANNGKINQMVMASNLPIEDLDLHHYPDRSTEYIQKVIEFTSQLPNNTQPLYTPTSQLPIKTTYTNTMVNVSLPVEIKKTNIGKSNKPNLKTSFDKTRNMIKIT